MAQTQERKLDRPSKRAMPPQAAMKASWAASSASVGSALIFLRKDRTACW
jgi:hypothetical protein